MWRIQIGLGLIWTRSCGSMFEVREFAIVWFDSYLAFAFIMPAH